jgi:hypothetical protein
MQRRPLAGLQETVFYTIMGCQWYCLRMMTTSGTMEKETTSRAAAGKHRSAYDVQAVTNGSNDQLPGSTNHTTTHVEAAAVQTYCKQEGKHACFSAGKQSAPPHVHATTA